MLIAEHPAGSSDSCLHLVDYKEDVLLSAQLLRSLYKLLRKSNNSALSLYHLKHNSAGIIVNQFLKLLYIIRFAVSKARIS